MYSSITALSSTVFVIAPLKQYGWDAAQPSGLLTLGIVPTDALKPKQPHQDAGIRIDPPPSDPSPIRIMPSATAAALPPEEPPELYPGLNGVEVGP